MIGRLAGGRSRDAWLCEEVGKTTKMREIPFRFP